MIDPLLVAMLAGAGAYEPPPAVFYPQAGACAATALVAKSENPTGEEVGDLITWGMIVADMGRKSGRTSEQVESDVKAAEPFFRRLKEKKPPAFAAHRAYCEALLDADRP